MLYQRRWPTAATGKTRVWLTVLVTGFLLEGATAASAQGDAFEGRLVNLAGDGKTRDGKFELGGGMSNRGADGTRLFAISLGRERAYFVLLWKPVAGDPKEFSPPKDDEIFETWLWTEPFVTRVQDHFEATRAFIDDGPDRRQQVGGAFHLRGKVHVRRFRSTGDFQIDIDAATIERPPRKLVGTIYRGGNGPEGGEARDPVPAKAPPPPAGVKLDAPLKAVRAYAEALRDGDENKLRAVLLPAGADGQRAVDLFVRWAVSSARLERTAAAKFGRAGADRVAQALVLPTAASRGKDLLENVADADVAVRDDRATVEIEPVGSIELRRVEGRWGIYVADSDVDAGRDDTNLLKALTAAQEQVATRIESGQVTTVEEAARAIGAVAEDAGRAAGREPQAPGPDPGN